MAMNAFDTERYLAHQVRAFKARIAQIPEGGRAVIEFGGKPIDDQHAARVLPGYDPDAKIELLRRLELETGATFVMAVSSRDLLKPRIRGDSQLFYGMETIRVIESLRAKGVRVTTGVITMVPHDLSAYDRVQLDQFKAMAYLKLGLQFQEMPKFACVVGR